MLPLFRSPSQKDDELVPVPAKIDAITGAKINGVLTHPGTNRFDVREVALFHANNGRRHLCCRWSVEIVEPFCKGTSSILVFVLSGDRQGSLRGEEFQVEAMVTRVVPLVKDGCLCYGRVPPLIAFFAMSGMAMAWADEGVRPTPATTGSSSPKIRCLTPP